MTEFRESEIRSDALDLPFLAGDPSFQRRGWSELEGRGPTRVAWAVGGRSRVVLPLYSAGDKELLLRGRCHESLGPSLPLRLTLNDAPLPPITVTPAEQEFRLVLPGSAQARGDNVLTLESPRRREPAPGDPDRRPLVAAFSVLTVCPIGSTGRAAAPTLDGAQLLLPPSSSVAHYLRLPADARLSLEARAGAEGTPRLQASVEDDSSRATVLDAVPDRHAGGSETSIPNGPGRIVRLELSNQGPTGLVRLSLARLTGEPSPPAPAEWKPPWPARPNVIVYLVDTLRADHLGAYGHSSPTSPRFDAFAREGLLFADGWAQASWTRSAVASIFTGLHVGTHGVDREDRALSPALRTLAQSFKQGGYRTGAFVGNHLLGGRFGFEKGFDTWNGGERTLYGSPAELLVDRALRWLDSGSSPALLYVHVMEPHSPYVPSDADAAPFDPGPYRGDRDTRALLRRGQLGQLPPEGLRFLETRYQGEVHQSDRGFGALLDGLLSREVLDRSVVVFTADHGEELLDHGGTEHTKTLYQELVRVPLAVRLPGGRGGGTRRVETVQQTDLYPTLVRLAGLSVPEGLQGRDLAARWLGPAEADPVPPVFFSEERFEVVDKFAARSGGWKLILNNDGPALWRAGSHLELYDLASDPGERRNLATSHPVVTTFLRQRIERFRRVQAALLEARGPAAVTLSAEEREQLRALGYVQ